MPRLIINDETIKYRLRYDRDNDNEVYFYIKPLTQKENLRLADSIPINLLARKQTMNTVERLEQIFLNNIDKVEGLTWTENPNEEPVTITSDEDLSRLFNMLSVVDGQEILAAIQDSSILRAGEVKN